MADTNRQIPIGLLNGLEPISEEEALAIRERRSDSGKQAACTFQRKVDHESRELGLDYGSRTARAKLRGEISEWQARWNVSRIRHRHEFTDYDELLEHSGYVYARESFSDPFTTDDWEAYLDHYGFDDAAHHRLAEVLSSPRKAHPVWFDRAAIVVEWALDQGRLLSLGDLDSYEQLCGLIDQFKSLEFENL